VSDRSGFLRFGLTRLGAWLLAALATYVISSTLATQSVIANLGRMGVQVPLGQRLSTTIQDLAGMSSMFLPLIAFSLLIAFVVASILSRWLAPRRTALFILAGFTGVIALHLILEAMLGITPVAAARTAGGLLLQGVGGAVGGWLFIGIISNSVRKPGVIQTEG
jgi:hypothetical protein